MGIGIRRPSPAGLVPVTLWIGTLSTFAQAQESPRADEADEAYAELRKLLESAPGRQVGQPGNSVVDKLIADRFAEAVAAQNDPERRERARRLVEEADRAERVLMEARQRAQVTSPRSTPGGSAVIASHFLARMTLEKPGLLVGLLVVAAAILGVTWRVKRRRSLGIAAGVVIGTAVLLAIVAALVDTRAERIASDPELAARLGVQTEETLKRAVVGGAREALEADIRAAEALRGLWQSGRMTFPSAAFVPGRTVLVAGEDGKEVRLYQMSPNLVEPANLDRFGYEGWLTYVGTARPDDLAGKDVHGAAVLIDFDSGNHWLDAAQLGAEAVIVLEPPEGTSATLSQAAQKVTASPLSVPRYYLKREDMAAAFGEGWLDRPAARTKVSIRQEPGRWKRVELATDWLFIPGTAAPKGPETSFPEDPSRQIVHIQAYKDCASIVPELSPGASSGANLVLLLRLLRRFEEKPPRRPVLLSVVNDHSNALNGEQEYAYAAFAEPRAVREELEEIDRELACQRLIERVFGRPPTPELIEDLRDRLEMVGGRVFRVKTPAVDRLSRLCNGAREERNRLIVRLEKLTRGDEGRRASGTPGRDTSGEVEKLKAQIDAAKRESEDLVALVGLFNRLGTKTYLQELSPERQERCRKLFEHVEARARVEAEELERSRQRLLRNLTLRRRLLALSAPAGVLASRGEGPGKLLDKLPSDLSGILDLRYSPLPAVAVLSLDLSFGSDLAGFFHTGYLRTDGRFARDAGRRTSRLARHTLAVAAEYARTSGRPSRLADTIRKARGIPWQGHLGGRFAMGSRTAHLYAMAGLTLTSVRDSRPRAFTPHDTLDRLDRGHFAGLMEFAEGYLPTLVDSERFGHAIRSSIGERVTLSVELSVRKLDKFSITVPKTTLSDALVLAAPRTQYLPKLRPCLGQVRPWLVVMSDSRGSVTLRGSTWNGASLQAFAYDPDYRRTVAAIDLGDGEKRFASTLKIPRGTVFDSRSIVTFGARKVDLIGLTEPLTLMPATSIDVIDAHQDGTPRHYSLSGVLSTALASKKIPLAADGSGSVFIEPRARFKLRIGTGLVINATPEDPQGEGFPAETGRLRNIVLTSAQDMWRLTDSRLALLSKKGVVDETAVAVKEAAGRQLDAVEAAREAGRNDLVQVGAEEARGLAYRTYSRALSTTNDLIKAVVILLGLVIPFCFFVMKLVTPSTEINRQLALFVAIFVGMAALLHFVHPAFEVAKTPQVVILAFVILGLAVFVASILIGRFNSSMTQAVEESQQSESVEAPQSRLAGVAFMVGVNNMKRRRIRTSLTTATIVLVTFTMLSVISVGRDVEPVQLRLGGDAPYDGFVYASPALGPIDPVQVRRLRAHLADRAVSVARVWSERKGAYGEYLPVELRPVAPDEEGATADVLEAKIVLGLEVAEDGFLGPMPILEGGRWFSSDEAQEVLLSRSAAALIGITPESFRGPEVGSTTSSGRGGHQLWLRGRRVELVGLLDDEKIEAMRDVADLPLLPLLTEASQQKKTQATALAAETSAAALVQAGGLADLPGTHVARAREVAVVPVGFALSLGDAEFHSLSVKYEPRAGEEPFASEEGAARSVWEDVISLMRFQDVRVFVSLAHPVSEPEENLRLDVGQYAMVSSSTAEVAGVLKVAIPVVLAATIILNTMLGSVMERRREIGIYNAIGLNPTHVMVFFLAESLVFGLVGSIAGYMIGQILSLALSHFHFIDLNLNYSSLSVMLVIFLAIATVLVSTAYPAMMAARAAVPSGQRRWSLPQPDGDQIHVKFPFSYDADRAMGVCAYLRDFMKQNSEASTGKFLAKLGPVGVVPVRPAGAGDGDKAYAMIFDIAPAPFDLGVNQKMEVYAYYDPFVRAHMLSVHLTRLSGQISSWVKVNQPFLEALRKRLLGWRSQRQQTQEEFYRRGQDLFSNAPELPVRPGAGEAGQP